MGDFNAGDVLANAFGDLSRTFTGFADRLNEADRVSQYSSALASMDRAFSTYNRALKEKRWARPANSDQVAGTVAAEAGASDQLTLGQIDEETLAADYDAMLKEQRGFIRQNFRNKRAQEQALQALEMRSAQNYDQVANLWGTYKTHDLIAENDRNIAYWSEKTELTPEQRIAQITPLLQISVDNGLRFADDAAIYLEKVTEEVQSSWATTNAIEQAKAAKWDTTVADQWLDTHTPFWDLDPVKREAARNMVRGRVQWEQQEQTRLYDAHDDEADIALEKQVLLAIDDPVMLRKLRDTLPAAQFKLEGRQQRWTDYLTNRSEALEAASVRTGPDLDKEDDPQRMDEYLKLRSAFYQQRPLEFEPQFGGSTMKSLSIGRIPSSDDLQSYLLANNGQYLGPNGAAAPRLRKSFVEGEHKELGSTINASFREAKELLWKATEATKENPFPTLSRANAGALEAELRAGFMEGRYKEEDLADIAARWAVRKAIETAVTSNMPLNQQLAGGVKITDSTEQFLNDVANHWFTAWQGRDDAGAIRIGLDQQARQIQTRVVEYVGKAPGRYNIQDNGDVWYWYPDPADPSNRQKGDLFRFAPTVVDEKTAQYADPAPKIQQYDKNTRQWMTPEDQRPFSDRDREAQATAKSEAERAAREADLLAQAQKDAVDLLPKHRRNDLGVWFDDRGQRVVNAQIKERLDRAYGINPGAVIPNPPKPAAAPSTTVVTPQDAMKMDNATLLATYEHKRGIFGGWFERSTGLRITQRALTEKLDAAERAK